LRLACAVLFHPDYTVGSGVSPDLLTFRCRKRSRALPPVGNFTPPWERLSHSAASGRRQYHGDRICGRHPHRPL